MPYEKVFTGLSGERYTIAVKYYDYNGFWFVHFYSYNGSVYLHNDGEWRETTYYQNQPSAFYKSEDDAFDSLRKMKKTPFGFQDVVEKYRQLNNPWTRTLFTKSAANKSDIEIFYRMCELPIKSKLGKIVRGPWGRLYCRL